MQAKVADSRPSCRNAILDAIERLHQRTGATAFARRDILAEIQATGASFERQTIYRCLRRMTGQEPGGAHHDLEDLGNAQLRRCGD
jgi:Fe2+ or Zn2+ uptake regulation protein